jgi:ferredoxin
MVSMADKSNRLPDNAPGKWYVDNTCIDCDACRQVAPNNFARNEEAGYSYVSKQPENEEEEKQCQEAMEGCPVESIGNDGD